MYLPGLVLLGPGMSNLQARSSATSMLANVRELKLSAIIVLLPGVRSRLFRRSPALGKKQPLQVGGVPENAGAFHRLGPRRPRQHGAGQFERRQRVGFEVAFRLWVFDRSTHGMSYFLSCPLVRCCGAPGLLFDQPKASGLTGSETSTRVSAWVHFGHS